MAQEPGRRATTLRGNYPVWRQDWRWEARGSLIQRHQLGVSANLLRQGDLGPLLPVTASHSLDPVFTGHGQFENALAVIVLLPAQQQAVSAIGGRQGDNARGIGVEAEIEVKIRDRSDPHRSTDGGEFRPDQDRRHIIQVEPVDEGQEAGCRGFLESHPQAALR